MYFSWEVHHVRQVERAHFVSNFKLLTADTVLWTRHQTTPVYGVPRGVSHELGGKETWPSIPEERSPFGNDIGRIH